MADRKYRQQGYRSNQSSDAGRREPPPSTSQRSGGMLAKHTVSRCAACGAVLPLATAPLEQCPDRRPVIPACRPCAPLATSPRFACEEPIPERIADKNARNKCAVFSLRVTVERDASPDSPRPGDIRRGFDNLFKK